MKLNNKGNASTLLAKIKKEFKDEVQVGAFDEEIDALTTGSLSLDIATGIGGFPRGRVSVLTGAESSGKTTMALKAIAKIQAMGGSAVFIDTEFALDTRWATKQGVNMEELIWLKPEGMEVAGEISVDVAQSGEVDIIVFDSVGGAPIKAVVEGDLGDANMGKRAKLMSDMLTKLTGPVSNNNVWMIFINQLRSSFNQFAPKPVQQGGKALPYHMSLHIDLNAKREKTASGKDPEHVDISFVIEKNKVGAPYIRGKYMMDFDGYIDPIPELADIITDITNYGTALGVERAGAWYTLPQDWFPDQESKFQGKGAIMEALADVETLERVTAKVRELLIP